MSMSPPGSHQEDSNMAEHLDEMSCMLYLEGQLDRARALEVSNHTQACSACRNLLRARHELRNALEGTGVMAAGGAR